MNTANYD